jgi:Flp pilus assembly protein TadD
MKSGSLLAAALVSSLAVAGGSVSAYPTSQEQNALRVEAQAELDRVTVDVDQANIIYSPADNGVGSDFGKVEEYQQEYLAGRRSFQHGKYSEAVQHFRKADELIRAQPDWTESE